MDKNEFFRLATLSICGSLQIETALHECVCTIRNLIPVDRMYLMIYEPGLGAMRTLAMGSPKKGKKLDWLTPLPRAARENFQYYLNEKPSGALIIDSPMEDLVAREMLRGANTTEWSVMCMELSTQCGQLGQVALTAKGANQYTNQHADLFSMLQNPFAIALANTLRHREVIKSTTTDLVGGMKLEPYLFFIAQQQGCFADAVELLHHRLGRWLMIRVKRFTRR